MAVDEVHFFMPSRRRSRAITGDNLLGAKNWSQPQGLQTLIPCQIINNGRASELLGKFDRRNSIQEVINGTCSNG